MCWVTNQLTILCNKISTQVDLQMQQCKIKSWQDQVEPNLLVCKCKVLQTRLKMSKIRHKRSRPEEATLELSAVLKLAAQNHHLIKQEEVEVDKWRVRLEDSNKHQLVEHKCLLAQNLETKLILNRVYQLKTEQWVRIRLLQNKRQV